MNPKPHREHSKSSDINTPLYAALDLGTNNCRLLIASVEGGLEPKSSLQLKVAESFSRIVKLGEGVSKTGRISDESMERTLEALKVCKKKLDRHEIHLSRFVATEVARRAENTQDFLKLVRAEVGLNIDVISNEEEARLAFLGCASLLTQTANRAIVFDIGGGSTELMWIDVDEKHEKGSTISDWLSIDCGVMNLMDRFGGHDFIDVTYRDMVNYVAERIEPFEDANEIRETIGNRRVQMISTSGTVTTLAAIHLGLPRYDRTKIDGIKLRVSDLHETIRTLLKMRPSERFNHPCIGPDRVDFIISGCAIFDAISSIWPTGEITIADRGVREGIIISLLQQ
jgi:exopolyphosphatase / guanosine-5'-triphosphate,3'-diphosphate pyrophosphatase